MEFEQLASEMEPMIAKLLNKCRIYKNRDEYRQIALIALWKAYSSYDESKYSFKAYLYNQMRYDVIDALRYHAKREAVFIPTSDEKMAFYLENGKEILTSSSFLEKMFEQMTDEEKQLLHAVFVEQQTNEELAERFGISVEAAKKRKYRMKNKLKEMGKRV
ncbi:MAG: RNA polymerase sigma factor [Lysinibacillus sp.]